MIKVTEVRRTGGEGCTVLLSSGETVKTTLAVAAEMSVYDGRELSADEAREFQEKSALARARERAMRIISARAMSERELYDRLVEKGETEHNAADCVAWLRELHFLSDEDYAGMVVCHYAQKGYGRRRVRDELYRRKVPRELWDAALDELPEQDDTVDRLLRSRLKGEHPDRAELKKASDALLRRGFSWEEIRAAINRFNSDTGEDY